MIEQTESIKNLAAALAKAQAAMHGATKDRKNPAFKSEYATLASVIEAARGPLTENGIAFVQSPGLVDERGLHITTTLFHASGEWLRSTMTIPLTKRDPQGVGSATTYGCRYSLMAILGLPPVDDDGDAAMDRMPQNAKPASTPAKPDTVPLAQAVNESAGMVTETLIKALNIAVDEHELGAWFETNRPTIDALPDAYKMDVRKAYGAKMRSFREAA